MQSDEQFEQLIMQYEQLQRGAQDIKKMILAGDLDSAQTMLNSREGIYLNCKCMRNYLELTPQQEIELENKLNELRILEKENIELLRSNLDEIKSELKRTQCTEKIQQAYDFDENIKGNLINYKE